MKNNKQSSTLLHTFAALLFWLAIWQLLSLLAGSSFLLPSPLSAFKSLSFLLLEPAFYYNCAATLIRCFWGVLFSLTAGAATAALSYRFSFARTLLRLPVSFLKSVPVMAVIIYALLLLTSDNVPILACFLMCYPIAYTNLLSGLDQIDRQILELANVYQFSGMLKLRFLFIPAVVPELKAALSLIAGISWKSVVAAEVLAVPKYSMGYNLLNSKLYLETEALFAWVIAIIALSLLFEKILKSLAAKIAPSSYTGSRIRRTKAEAAEISPINDIHVEDCAEPVVITNLSKAFGHKQVFDAYSITFQAGSTTALMGPSGLGKTTLLRILSALEVPDSGQVSGVSHKKISHLFQEDCLLPWLNVYDNLILVLSEDSRIKNMLSLLELSESIYKMPDELSGGMRRRAALARALLAPSDLLLLDEPLEGLDLPLKTRLYSRLRPLFAGKTVLIVTHNREDAEAIADTIITL